MTQVVSSAPPVLPEHVKKPNEEEYKKNIESINASIEKIQKQFVSCKKQKKSIILQDDEPYIIGCCQG